MKRLSYLNTGKTYLDEQPELESILKDFMDDLKPSYSEYYCGDPSLEPIECRPCDGFIPHSHNLGGFDKEYVTDFRTIQSTGCGLAEGYDYDTARADEINLMALDAWEHDLETESKNALKDVPKDKWNYNDLIDLGLHAVAEAQDAYCDEWLSGCSIFFGYRAMYEGKESSGWHTLMIYVSANESEYYGMCSKGSKTIKEYELKFRNAKELTKALNKIKAKLETDI